MGAFITLPAQNVSGIPIKTQNQNELATLKGPLQLIKGEIVSWDCEFRWHAFASDGKRVPISKGTLYRFIERTNTGWKVENRDGVFSIVRPPNNGAGFEPFKFAQISLVGHNAEIVQNRLGGPNKVVNTKEGTAFLYSKQITRAFMGMDSSTSTTTGVVGTQPFNAVTTTSGPSYIQTVSYYAYSFWVVFNSQGKVERIEDADPGVTFQRN